MSTLAIPITTHGQSYTAEVTTSLSHGYGDNVSSKLLDSTNKTVAFTPMTTYSDYCDSEIAYREIARMIDGIAPEAVFDALEDAGLSCLCDD